jgi:hypothetical protein
LAASPRTFRAHHTAVLRANCKNAVWLCPVYKVTFVRTNSVPVDIRAELRLRLLEVAATLASIPDHHIVWESLHDGEVQINVRGWQFFYRVDRKDKRVTVVRALPGG